MQPLLVMGLLVLSQVDHLLVLVSTSYVPGDPKDKQRARRAAAACTSSSISTACTTVGRHSIGITMLSQVSALTQAELSIIIHSFNHQHTHPSPCAIKKILSSPCPSSSWLNQSYHLLIQPPLPHNLFHLPDHCG